MILLNTEKGIVRIQTWAEIEERPGFQKKIDPKPSKLKAILGSYEFKDEVHCGLPCNQPHLKGYLVVTEEGAETNIGKDCGASYFSVNFEEMRVKFEKDMKLKERQETVRQFKARLPEFAAKVQALKEGGATRCYRLSRPLVEPHKGVPSRIVSSLSDMIRTGSSDVVVERTATDAEHEVLESQAGRRLPRPQTTRDRVGIVLGLGFFAPDLDLRRIIVEGIEPMLSKIEGIDETTARDRELGDWAKWIGGSDSELERIERAVSLGTSLLRQSNLVVLRQLLRTRDERAEFSAYLSQLDA